MLRVPRDASTYLISKYLTDMQRIVHEVGSARHKPDCTSEAIVKTVNRSMLQQYQHRHESDTRQDKMQRSGYTG